MAAMLRRSRILRAKFLEINSPEVGSVISIGNPWPFGQISSWWRTLNQQNIMMKYGTLHWPSSTAIRFFVHLLRVWTDSELVSLAYYHKNWIWCWFWGVSKFLSKCLVVHTPQFGYVNGEFLKLCLFKFRYIYIYIIFKASRVRVFPKIQGRHTHLVVFGSRGAGRAAKGIRTIWARPLQQRCEGAVWTCCAGQLTLETGIETDFGM